MSRLMILATAAIKVSTSFLLMPMLSPPLIFAEAFKNLLVCESLKAFFRQFFYHDPNVEIFVNASYVK